MELYELTVHELLEKLDNKEISVEDITKSYVDRINDKEKDVQAFVTVLDKEALEKAKEIKDRNTKFAGIPIGIKDNMCITGTKTTCSSEMLENFVAPYNATVIEKLNKENMIYLGKLNMDEFAMGASTEYSAFKKTRNPWDLNTVPGGSSGGSAAAVAANLVPWALRIRYRWINSSAIFTLWSCWIKTYIWASFKIWISSICLFFRSNRTNYKGCNR